MTSATSTPRPATLRSGDGGDPERFAVLAFVALATLAFAYALRKGHGNTFFFDEWGWIESRRSGLHAIFAADNNHLLVLQTALYQLLFHTVGLNHYWVFRAFEAAVHIACVTAVFWFARQRIGGPGALLGVVPLAFLGTGWQFVLWGAAGFGFLASIALCIAALLLLDRGDCRGDVTACALLVFALACSDYTLAFLVGIAVELLWRRRPLSHIWIWAIPAALYVVWWLGHHHASTIRENLTAAPGFALDAFAGALGALFGLGIEWGRPLAVAALLAIVWTLSRPGAMTARRAGLLVAAAVFWLLLGLGRAQLVDPWASRYVYTGAIFILLIGAEVLAGVGLSLRSLGIGALLPIFAVAGNLRAFDQGEGLLRTSSQQVAAELGALELARATAPAGLVIDARYAPVLRAGPYFAAVDDLGSSPAYTPDQILMAPEYVRVAADRVLVQARSLQVEARPALSTGASPPVIDATTLGATRPLGGCVEFSSAGSGAALDLTVGRAGVELLAAAGPAVEVRYRRFARTFDGVPIATVPEGSAMVLRPIVDRSPLRWHIRLSPRQRVRACAVA